MAAEPVVGPDAHQLDPALSPRVRAAYLVEGEGVVDPAAFVRALRTGRPARRRRPGSYWPAASLRPRSRRGFGLDDACDSQQKKELTLSAPRGKSEGHGAHSTRIVPGAASAATT